MIIWFFQRQLISGLTAGAVKARNLFKILRMYAKDIHFSFHIG